MDELRNYRDKPQETKYESLISDKYKNFIKKGMIYPAVLYAIFICGPNFASTSAALSRNPQVSREQFEKKIAKRMVYDGDDFFKSSTVKLINTVVPFMVKVGKPGRELAYYLFEKD